MMIHYYITKTLLNLLKNVCLLKLRSVPIYYTINKNKFVKACLDIDRNLKEFEEHEISKQYRQFLDRMKDVTKNYSVEKLDK